MTFRRVFLLSLGPAALAQVLFLAAFYYWTRGCACAAMPPDDAARVTLATMIMDLVDPLLWPQRLLNVVFPWRIVEYLGAQIPGPLGVWSPYLLGAAINAVAWSLLLAALVRGAALLAARGGRRTASTLACAVLLLAGCARGDAPAGDTLRPGATASASATDTVPPPDGIGAAMGCSAEARPSITLVATDARTGATLDDRGIVVRLDAPDSTARHDAGRAGAGPHGFTQVPLEQAGRFSVRVARPGYRPWDTTGVVVTRDRCHVQTVRLTVRLEPL